MLRERAQMVSFVCFPVAEQTSIVIDFMLIDRIVSTLEGFTEFMIFPEVIV